jgi:hypothetical protein
LNGEKKNCNWSESWDGDATAEPKDLKAAKADAFNIKEKGARIVYFTVSDWGILASSSSSSSSSSSFSLFLPLYCAVLRPKQVSLSLSQS